MIDQQNQMMQQQLLMQQLEALNELLVENGNVDEDSFLLSGQNPSTLPEYSLMMLGVVSENIGHGIKFI